MTDLGSGVLLEATTTGSGTGNYDSFLRLQATNIEQGFNTDENGNVLDNKASFTHDLQYGNIQTINVGNIDYIEFRLDLNESNNAVNADITLTGLDIYISDAGATLADYNAGFTTGFTSIFHLGPDQFLVDANHGSGTDDYRVLVPVSDFTAAHVSPGSYVTLYSSFSGSNGGFEEWRTTTKASPVTDPPAIAIDKVTIDGATAGDGITVLAGDSIKWQYAITSNVALSNIVVTDNIAGVTPVAVVSGVHTFNIGDINDNHTLDVGETWLFTASGTAIKGDYANIGHVSGTAGAVTVTSDDGSSYFGADPEISVDKVTVDGDKSGDNLTILSGEPISWQYTVKNTGNVALSDVTVTDNIAGVTPVAVTGDGHLTNIGDVNDNGKLDIDETWLFTAGGTSVAGSYSNIGTATGKFTDTAGDVGTATDTDGSGYTGADPEIKIDKVTVDDGTKGDTLKILTGEPISWEYTVTNVGNVALSGVTVTDSDAGVTPVAVLGDGHVTNIGDLNDNNKLDIGEVWKFSATGAAVTGPYSNTGTASGSFTDDASHTRTDTATDDSGYFGADPEIKIDKVTVDGLAKSDTLTILTGEPISWEYTVTNVGNVALSGVTVSDSDGAVTPVAVTGNGHVTNIGDINDNNKLDIGEVWKFSATGVAVTGPYSNTGTASGSFTDDANHTRTDTATDDSGYFGANPHITLDKKTNGVDHGLDIFQGQAVTWTYDVKNDGNVALTHVVVIDDNGTAGTGDDFTATGITSGGFNTGDINGNNALDVGETWHYKATGVAQLGTYTNTATATTDAFVDTAGHSRIPLATDSSDYEGFSNKALTQGFWGSHSDAWDNVAGNEGNPTKSAVASGVLSSVDVNPRTDGYLLLGDSNGDGFANDAHDLLISISLAKAIESSSTGGDARVIMLQQAIAAQLNIDNHVAQPNDLVGEAVMWLKGEGTWSGLGIISVDADNNGIVDQNGAALLGAAVKTSSNAWTKYVDVTDASSGITDWNGGKEADGEGLKNALMWFNQGQLVTSGSGPTDHVAWFNGTSIIDEHPNTLDQFWLTLHEVGGLTGIA